MQIPAQESSKQSALSSCVRVCGSDAGDESRFQSRRAFGQENRQEERVIEGTASPLVVVVSE